MMTWFVVFGERGISRTISENINQSSFTRCKLGLGCKALKLCQLQDKFMVSKVVILGGKELLAAGMGVGYLGC